MAPPPETPSVTVGAIPAIISEQVDRDTFHPIFQVLDAKKLKGSDRYRLVCSDTIHYTQCMAASQLNKLIADQLTEGSLIKLDKYLVNSLQAHRIIIVLSFQVVSCNHPKLGNPTDFHKSAKDVQQQHQPPTSLAHQQPPPLLSSSTYQNQMQPPPPPQVQQYQQSYHQQQQQQYQPPPQFQQQPAPMPQQQQFAYQQQHQPQNNYQQQQPQQTVPQHFAAPPPPPPQHQQNAFPQQYNNTPSYQQQHHQQQRQFGTPLQNFPAAEPHLQQKYPPASKPASNPPQGGGVNSISSLNPYMQRFVLRARVTSKGEKKEWNKPTSQGQLFSVDLADASGEIRGTMFRDLVDKYLNVLQEGRMYTITDTSPRIKQANKQWTSLTHEYEINFGNATFEECADDASVPLVQGAFVKIGELPQRSPEEKVDIVAVVKSADPISSFISKRDNTERKKREVTIVDDSGFDVRLTFWGEVGMKPDEFWAKHPIVLAKGCRISSFGGVSLSTSFSGTIKFDMSNQAETTRLRQWWRGGGYDATSTPLTNGAGGTTFAPVAFSQRGVIDDIKSKGLGLDEKPSYLTFKATLNFIKQDRMWYEACSNEGCQKKVTENSDSTWHCEKCGTTLENCRRRYMLSGTFIDESGQTWITSFNDTALVIFNNVTADQVAQYKEEVENHPGVFEDYMKSYLFRSFVVKVRVKNEIWQEQSRIKTNIVSLSPVEFATESRQLLEAIKTL